MSLTTLDKSQGIALFTDGSAWAKDKSGGWAWIAIDAFGSEAHNSGAESNTTNNRMEMLAWIKGLEEIFQALGPCEVLVYSDSEYVGLGCMDRKRKRNCNPDLWKELDATVEAHIYVEFCHVKGHDGHSFNERVDKLAGDARQLGKAHANCTYTCCSPTRSRHSRSRSARNNLQRDTKTKRRKSDRRH